MLSNQASPDPHWGQREGGRTTDSFGSAPHRRMQTLRKLPNTAPTMPASAMKKEGGMVWSANTGQLVEQNAGRHGNVERLSAGRERNPYPAHGLRCEA